MTNKPDSLAYALGQNYGNKTNYAHQEHTYTKHPNHLSHFFLTLNSYIYFICAKRTDNRQSHKTYKRFHDHPSIDDIYFSLYHASNMIRANFFAEKQSFFTPDSLS